MIIPIRCMNCGNVLADKWLWFQAQRKEVAASPIYMDGKSIPKTKEADLLDRLGLVRICCRKHMLTHVDLIEKI